ncbi:MAG: exonuclease domain-containing protein [Burkholderiaceae bacterium]
MRRDRQLVVASVAAGLVAVALLGAWLAAIAALVGADLSAAQRQILAETLRPRAALIGLSLLMLVAVTVLVMQALYRRWVAPAARLLEQTRALLTADVECAPDAAAGTDLQALARAIHELAGQRSALRRDMQRNVDDASREVAQERNRLAALMSELTQSVVVCNLDGRILLYNNRARLQSRALSAVPALADGAELIGLGRSIYNVLDRRIVAHALDTVRQRVADGAAHPSAQFVTTTGTGQLLRVQMAPVRESGEAPAEAEVAQALDLAGFVLMLDNITQEFEQAAGLDRLLHDLTEGSRGSLANLQAALEILDDPALGETERERFLRVVRDEAGAMTRRLQQLSAHGAADRTGRWPLEEMLGADLIAAARHRLEHQLGLRVRDDEIDTALWLRVESFSLLQALVTLATRLRDECDVTAVRLRLAGADAAHAQLDLVWSGSAINTETVMSWELDPMTVGAQSGTLSVRDVVARHGGEFWFERERVRHEAFFRFLLPLARAPGEVEVSAIAGVGSRPEYYDFDLFRVTESTRALDDRLLRDLSYTVFDTETTGLEPSAGDEIIQVGAVRVFNGKLLRHESFEQLVDPGRSIPGASIPIHGIRPEMVVGKPTIDAVLPAFYAYAHDTVLVAHNAAFDMRFLQLKEVSSGVRFDQPVLDTLLLSTLVQPNQASHRLEAIAQRFGIPVIGRHTALGDALVTAEVLLKLIPLLAEHGIHTLGQARAAARQSYLARIRY